MTGSIPVRICKVFTFKNSTTKYNDIADSPEVAASNSEKNPKNLSNRIITRLERQIFRIKLPVTSRITETIRPKDTAIITKRLTSNLFPRKLEAKQKITMASGIEKMIMSVIFGFNPFTLYCLNS